MAIKGMMEQVFVSQTIDGIKIWIPDFKPKHKVVDNNE
jgi:hypothetical protein